MKNFAEFLFVISLGLSVASCNFTQATSKMNFSPKSVRVILEMDSLNYGSMDSFNGRNLSFRLFENGEYEYEEISEQKLKELNKQGFSSEVIIKKQGLLSTESLSEIKEMLANTDLQKYDYFKNKEGFCTCGASRLEIRFKAEQSFIRNINIDGANCADLKKPDPKVFPNFPKPISKLIEKVQSIKYPEQGNSTS